MKVDTYAIAFQSTRVTFDPTKGEKRQTEPGHATFSRSVKSANAAIKGFQIGYTDMIHYIFLQEVDIVNI